VTLPKPYPPTPIDYEDWNILIDALEARFGSAAIGFIRDRTRIVNSRGNIWDKAAGNAQLAIEDVLLDEGGAVWLPKGKITETLGWVMDEEKPVHIFGAGMCWHDLDRGTMIKFSLPNGVHCVDIDAPATIHFGGLYDMTLYPASGDRDVVHLDSVSDWHMDRIYINQAKRHGLHVESTGDSWNIWVEDCLIENCTQKGIRLEGGAGAGVILKSYFLNNYFYANGVDTPDGREIKQGIVGVFAANSFNPKENIRLKDESTISLSQYAARRNLQLVTAADFNRKLREHGSLKRVTVQKVCRLARDEEEVRRTVDYIWGDPEGALKILKELTEKNRDLYLFEKMLES